MHIRASEFRGNFVFPTSPGQVIHLAIACGMDSLGVHHSITSRKGPGGAWNGKWWLLTLWASWNGECHQGSVAELPAHRISAEDQAHSR